MKNEIENQSIVELDANELKEINGGIAALVAYAAFAAGVAAGYGLFKLIKSWCD